MPIRYALNINEVICSQVFKKCSLMDSVFGMEQFVCCNFYCKTSIALSTGEFSSFRYARVMIIFWCLIYSLMISVGIPFCFRAVCLTVPGNVI